VLVTWKREKEKLPRCPAIAGQLPASVNGERFDYQRENG
jgi:hypothetical protein